MMEDAVGKMVSPVRQALRRHRRLAFIEQ